MFKAFRGSAFWARDQGLGIQEHRLGFGFFEFGWVWTSQMIS